VTITRLYASAPRRAEPSDPRREHLTPNRSAGHIEDEPWEAFLAKAKAEGISSDDAMRRMIRMWTGMREPAATLVGAGSGVDAISQLSHLRVGGTSDQVIAELVVATADDLLAAAEQLAEHRAQGTVWCLDLRHCLGVGRGG